ncbi:unnamed protein product [Pieris brassicae]|uniref:Uncharacterized protein n=1 Tax=Pieris brassicae TaxID=7116 RepID=A0A9P0SWP7_PIEBR|nr:unnamed protein product [Pieris brassicae]
MGRDAGARARPHGDCGDRPDYVRPHPNTISGATLRTAAARPSAVGCQFYAKLRAGGEAICTSRVCGHGVAPALVTLH